MKIDDYISKHQVKSLEPSLASVPTMPNAAFSDELLLPSFAGANSDGTVFVTTYDQHDFFCGLRKRETEIGRKDWGGLE